MTSIEVQTTVDVNIHDFLAEASTDEIRSWLEERESITGGRVGAIKDLFAAVAAGSIDIAMGIVPGIFSTQAECDAARNGIREVMR